MFLTGMNIGFIKKEEGGGSETFTDVYNIDFADLVDTDSGNSNTRYTCNTDASPGFQWTDATPAGATITNVTIEFKIGAECDGNAPSTKTSSLNSVAQPNFVSTVTNCNLNIPSPAPLITLNVNPGDYIIGSNNVFGTGDHFSCFGFERSPDLDNYFAQITVEYSV